MVKSFCVFIHIIPIVSSTCFVTDYTLIPHNSNEGTETAKGLYIPVVIKITNINLHREVSMTHNGKYVHIITSIWAINSKQGHVVSKGTRDGFDLASKLICLHDECHISLGDTDVMSVLKIPWRKWNLKDWRDVAISIFWRIMFHMITPRPSSRCSSGPSHQPDHSVKKKSGDAEPWLSSWVPGGTMIILTK